MGYEIIIKNKTIDPPNTTKQNSCLSIFCLNFDNPNKQFTMKNNRPLRFFSLSGCVRFTLSIEGMPFRSESSGACMLSNWYPNAFVECPTRLLSTNCFNDALDIVSDSLRTFGGCRCGRLPTRMLPNSSVFKAALQPRAVQRQLSSPLLFR